MMLFPTNQTVLLVEDDEAMRAATVQQLELAGFQVEAFPSALAALPQLTPDFGGMIVSDIRMPRLDGLQFLERVRAIDPEIPIVLVTGHADVPMAVQALRDGAFDFLTKPFAADQLIASITRGLDHRLLVLDNRRLRAAAGVAQQAPHVLLGDSGATARLRETVEQVARTDVDVLVEGETGTGKELVALMLHRLSARRARPFVAVNCGALPDSVAESELFGHAADSVPHSRLARIGQIEMSNGGTLLLDEVDSMPLPIQVKLLRVLEEREVHPIGAERPRPIDLRVVATSKCSIGEAVEAGRFRADLYYRLNVVRLHIPPLRDRPEDIVPLFASFTDEACQQCGLESIAVTDAVRRYLATHNWPGNVRELRNYAFQSVLKVSGAEADIPADAATLGERMRAFETALIEEAVRANCGNISAALTQLGIPRKTFYDKVSRLGIPLAELRGKVDAVRRPALVP